MEIDGERRCRQVPIGGEDEKLLGEGAVSVPRGSVATTGPDRHSACGEGYTGRVNVSATGNGRSPVAPTRDPGGRSSPTAALRDSQMPACVPGGPVS